MTTALSPTRIISGHEYVLCETCSGTGTAQRADETFCGECFGGGWVPVPTSWRSRFGQVATTVIPSGGRPAGGGPSRPAMATYDPSLIEWLAKQTWSDFAQSLAEQAKRTGRLSPAQVASATSMKAKCEAREAAKRTERAVEAKSSDEDPLDLSHVPSGLYAVPGGDTRLKVQIDNVRKGKWDGWVFVKDAAVYGEGRRYGSQKPGQYYKGQITEALRVIAADPMAAAAAYGQLTSTCGRCGRPLEDKDSVARGLGPDCAKKPWRI